MRNRELRLDKILKLPKESDLHGLVQHLLAELRASLNKLKIVAKLVCT